MKSGLALAIRPRNQVSAPVPLGGSAGFMSLPGLAMGLSDRETFMRAYGTVGTIFSIVSLYASSTARSPWQMFRTELQDHNRYTTRDEGSDQRQQVPVHPALTLIRKPNPFYSGFQLRELSQTYLDLTGEAYLLVGRDPRSSIPTSLWPVRPDRMDPVPDPDAYLKGYVYTSPDGRQKIPLTCDEVVFCRYPNPLDPYHGLGPVQSVLVDIDAARYSAEWNRNFFINSAEPGGVVQFDHGFDDDEWIQMMDHWREQHRGVSRAHRVAFLEAGGTWVPNTHTAQDMDFGNLRGVSRDIMREAFRMHKVMLGVSDDVNRANAQTGEEVFATWGVTPRLDRWKDAYDYQYLPLFGSVGQDVELDYVTPIPPNREQDNAELTSKSQAALVLVQAGYDQAAVLQTVGLPDMPLAEKPTQSPALPPGWVPAMPPGPGGAPGGGGGLPPGVIPAQQGESEGESQNLARQMAAWNQLEAAR